MEIKKQIRINIRNAAVLEQLNRLDKIRFRERFGELEPESALEPAMTFCFYEFSAGVMPMMWGMAAE